MIQNNNVSSFDDEDEDYNEDNFENETCCNDLEVICDRSNNPRSSSSKKLAYILDEKLHMYAKNMTKNIDMPSAESEADDCLAFLDEADEHEGTKLSKLNLSLNQVNQINLTTPKISVSYFEKKVLRAWNETLFFTWYTLNHVITNLFYI